MVKRDDELARGSIPELGAVICACRQNPRAVGTKCAVPDPILMLKGGDELARGSIPELGGVVCACSQDPSTVRTERRAYNLILMVKRGDGKRQRFLRVDNQFLKESLRSDLI